MCNLLLLERKVSHKETDLNVSAYVRLNIGMERGVGGGEVIELEISLNKNLSINYKDTILI